MSQNLIKVMKKFYQAREDNKIWWNTEGSGDEFNILLYGDNIAIGQSFDIADDTDYYEWIGDSIEDVAEQMDDFIENIDVLISEIRDRQEEQAREDEENERWFKEEYCDWE